MPIPKPKKSEKQSEFVSRCMGNDTMNKEFPDQKQRAAVCYSQWGEKKAKANLIIGDGENEMLFQFNENKALAETLEEYKSDFLGMTLGSIKSIKQHAENIINALENGDEKVKANLTEPFIQPQVALAEDYMLTIHNYVMFADEEREEDYEEDEAEAAAEEINVDNLYIPEESEYVLPTEVSFNESDLMEYDIAKERPGLWENIRRKKQREGKNYKPAKPGDKDRPSKEAWKKAQGSEYQGRKVTLNKPFRTSGGPKKFAVYVKNQSGNVVIVRFGDPNMKIKKNIPSRRKSFRARHNCDNPGPKWKARYWSCKAW
jgi:hypothetical protein